MDRVNNGLGHPIGVSARSPDEVVMRARTRIGQAAVWGGTGHNNTPIWLESRRWGDPVPNATRWPTILWSDIQQAPHLAACPGREAPSAFTGARAPDGSGKCPVSVAPHVRAGHPVRAYLRARAAE